MSFDVAAEAYAAFMGRYSEPLADRLLDLLDPAPGSRAADVGCGPGVVTARLALLLGPGNVVAVDPSVPFVEAARTRCPGVDVKLGGAEALPWDDASVDLAVAQLVVAFMKDPVAGLREMARVTRPGGTVAVSMWDIAGGRSPLSPLWRAATALWPGTAGEERLPGVTEGDLGRLLHAAGLDDVVETELAVSVGYDTFEEWWTPYTFGVGPAGDFVASLSDGRRAALKERCRADLGDPPLTIDATAWTATATATAAV